VTDQIGMPEGRLLPWTKERMEEALRLDKNGMSGSEIARAIGGTTRNAVIGKLNRLRGRKIMTIAESQPKPKPRLKQRPKAPPFVFGPGHSPDVQLPTPEHARMCVALPESRRVTIIGLRATTCRWPLSGFGVDMEYCGADCAVEYAYCQAHRQIAYAGRERPLSRSEANLLRTVKKLATASL
jgi:GcrA cell cycle regulator